MLLSSSDRNISRPKDCKPIYTIFIFIIVFFH